MLAYIYRVRSQQDFQKSSRLANAANDVHFWQSLTAKSKEKAHQFDW